MAATALEADLRLAVHRLRSGERRRRFPAALHVGDLTGKAATWVDETGLRMDQALRTDVALELLGRALDAGQAAPAVWLTRPGVPSPHDVDVAWHGPVRRALGALGVEARCVVVVTKQGWYDPLSGDGRTWRRLRVRQHRA